MPKTTTATRRPLDERLAVLFADSVGCRAATYEGAGPETYEGAAAGRVGGGGIGWVGAVAGSRIGLSVTGKSLPQNRHLTAAS
jgi:hypothetical protein